MSNIFGNGLREAGISSLGSISNQTQISKIEESILNGDVRFINPEIDNNILTVDLRMMYLKMGARLEINYSALDSYKIVSLNGDECEGILNLDYDVMKYSIGNIILDMIEKKYSNCINIDEMSKEFSQFLGSSKRIISGVHDYLEPIVIYNDDFAIRIGEKMNLSFENYVNLYRKFLTDVLKYDVNFFHIFLEMIDDIENGSYTKLDDGVYDFNGEYTLYLNCCSEEEYMNGDYWEDENLVKTYIPSVMAEYLAQLLNLYVSRDPSVERKIMSLLWAKDTAVEIK